MTVGVMESVTGFNEFVKPLISSLSSFSGKFIALGETFLGFALLVLLVNEIYAYFIGGGLQQLISRMLRNLLILSLPLAALLNWNYMAGSIAKFGLEMATVVGATADPETSAKQIGGQLDAAVRNMADTVVHTIFVEPFESSNPIKAVVKVLGNILIGVMFLPFFLLFIIAGIVFMFAILLALYMPMIMLQIGMIFGPLLVPWILLPSLASLATSWLRYMLGAAFSYAVASLLAAAVLKAGSDIFRQFAEYKPQGIEGLFAVGAAMLIVIITLLFGAYLMIRSDNIASAMIGAPNPSAGAEYLGGKMAGALAGALKGVNKKSTGGGEGGGGSGGGSGGGQSATQVAPSGNASSSGSSGRGASAAASSATPSGGGGSSGGGASAAAAAPSGGGASAAAAASSGGGSPGGAQNNAANAARRIQSSGGASSAGAGGVGGGSKGGTGGGAKGAVAAALRVTKATGNFASKALRHPVGRAVAVLAVAPAAIAAGPGAMAVAAGVATYALSGKKGQKT